MLLLMLNSSWKVDRISDDDFSSSVKREKRHLFFIIDLVVVFTSPSSIRWILVKSRFIKTQRTNWATLQPHDQKSSVSDQLISWQTDKTKVWTQISAYCGEKHGERNWHKPKYDLMDVYWPFVWFNIHLQLVRDNKYNWIQHSDQTAAPVSQRLWVQIPYGPEFFFQALFQLLVQ